MRKPSHRLGIAALTALLLALGALLGRPPAGLDALLLPTQGERDFQTQWLDLNGKIRLRPFSRRELPDWRWSAGDFHRQADGTALLILPEDVRLREVPLLVRDLETEAWGTAIPTTSFGRRLQALQEIAAAALAAREARAWAPWRWVLAHRRAQLEDMSRRAGGWRSLFEVEGLPLKERLTRIRALLRETPMDPEDRACAQRFLETVAVRPDQAEGRLAAELREAWPLAALRVSVQRMTREITEFTRADFDRFQSSGQIEANSPRNAEDYPEQGKRLWEVLELDCRRAALEHARAAGDRALGALELEAVKAVQAAVRRYPWSAEGWSGRTSTPDEIRRTRAMNCVGMSLLIHGCLQALGIPHQAVQLPRHAAVAVRTADGGDWLLDATTSAEPLTLGGQLPEGSATYLRPEALKERYGDNLAHRDRAETALAVAVLNNNAPASPLSSASWNHLLAWDPAYLLGFQNRYQESLKLGRLDEAAPALEGATRLVPDDPGLWVDAWTLETDLHHPSRARAAWQKAQQAANATTAIL
jgi:hypothetical protein